MLQLKVFEWVKSHYTVPPDFDTCLAKYGAMSGICHEERLVAAYMYKVLTRITRLAHIHRYALCTIYTMYLRTANARRL